MRSPSRPFGSPLRTALLAASLGVAPSLGSGSLTAQALSPVERRVANWVDAHAVEAVDFLRRIVDLNSGTMNPEGVRTVGRLLAAELEGLGFATRWIELPPEMQRSGHLFARRQGEAGKSLLLIGHLDTVFEKDSPFQRFELVGDFTARGPGVEDMKGGDVVLLFALKALEAAGALDGADITVALIGDEEEPGQPVEVTRRPLLEAGQRVDVALGFEGAVRTTGSATVARRGSSGWTLRVSGTPGHSSQIFGPRYGTGAIFEVARILDTFYREVRTEEYLTFNPGIVLGGTEVVYDPNRARGTAFGKTNVIPATVVVDGGLRFISEEQKERARARMREIVHRNLPGTSAEIEFTDAYPAMPPTKGNYALLEVLDQVSRDLGYGPVEPVDPGARGAADISFVAPWVDGLDGLGVLGEGGHTLEETVDLRSIPVQTKKAALLIYRLTRPAAN